MPIHIRSEDLAQLRDDESLVEDDIVMKWITYVFENSRNKKYFAYMHISVSMQMAIVERELIAFEKNGGKLKNFVPSVAQYDPCEFVNYADNKIADVEYLLIPIYFENHFTLAKGTIIRELDVSCTTIPSITT